MLSLSMPRSKAPPTQVSSVNALFIWAKAFWGKRVSACKNSKTLPLAASAPRFICKPLPLGDSSFVTAPERILLIVLPAGSASTTMTSTDSPAVILFNSCKNDSIPSSSFNTGTIIEKTIFFFLTVILYRFQ